LQPSLIPALVVALSVVSVSLVNNTQRHVISRPTAAPCDTISSLPTLQPCWFHDTGQPCVSGVCSESLEFPASSYHGCAFTARLLLRTQTELFRLSYPADWQSDIVCILHCSTAQISLKISSSCMHHIITF